MRIKSYWAKFKLGMKPLASVDVANDARFDVGITEMPDTIDTSTYMRA